MTALLATLLVIQIGSLIWFLALLWFAPEMASDGR